MVNKAEAGSSLTETPLENTTALRRAFGLIKTFNTFLGQDPDVTATFLSGNSRLPLTIIKDGIINIVEFRRSTIAEEAVFTNFRFEMEARPSLSHPSPPFRLEKIEIEARDDPRPGMSRALIKYQQTPVNSGEKIEYTNSEEAVAAIRAKAVSFRRHKRLST